MFRLHNDETYAFKGTWMLLRRICYVRTFFSCDCHRSIAILAKSVFATLLMDFHWFGCFTRATIFVDLPFMFIVACESQNPCLPSHLGFLSLRGVSGRWEHRNTSINFLILCSQYCNISLLHSAFAPTDDTMALADILEWLSNLDDFRTASAWLVRNTWVVITNLRRGLGQHVVVSHYSD